MLVAIERAALLVADTSDTPVWWLVIVTGLLVLATLALAGVTGVLAWAARRALTQLKLAVEELEEVKKDRHVQVFDNYGHRWQSSEMTEALQLERHYTPRQLARLIERSTTDPSRNPIKEYRRRKATDARVVLMRVPNYFEDALMTFKAGGLDAKLFAENFGGVAVDEWRRWGETITRAQLTDKKAYELFSTFVQQVVAEDAAEASAAGEAS